MYNIVLLDFPYLCYLVFSFLMQCSFFRLYIMFCYVLLHSIVLHSVVLHSIVLHSVVLHSVVLHSVILFSVFDFIVRVASEESFGQK